MTETDSNPPDAAHATSPEDDQLDGEELENVAGGNNQTEPIDYTPPNPLEFKT